MKLRNILLILLSTALFTPVLQAQTDESEEASPQEDPFTKGGIYDKPFITGLGDRLRIGGYVDAQFRHHRTLGIVEEQSFLLERVNLFVFSNISDRVRFISEFEFEDGGEEIKIELAIVDFELHESVTFRGGILLSPLGRFNQAHDSPANQLIDRPLVSTQIIPTTFSEVGMGFLGSFYTSATSRVTYEIYAVNGINDGLVLESGGNTFIPNGKSNFEDNNNHLSITGRIAYSPSSSLEIGASTHSGPYNVYELEGIKVDDKRNVSIFAVDGFYRRQNLQITWEYAKANIDIDPSFKKIYAENQNGFYVEGNYRFFDKVVSNMPESYFMGSVRYESINMNGDIDGDDARRIIIGLNFRPNSDTAFKLDFQHNLTHDTFNLEAEDTAILFGIASYF